MIRARHLMLGSLLAVTALAAGCATGPTIRIDKDPAADLSSYGTFGFFEQTGTDERQYSTLLTSRLKQATRDQLERRGYRFTEDSPNLRVNFFVKVDDRQEVRSTPDIGFYGYRRGLYRPWGGYTYDTVSYKQGTLSVDVVDAKKNALVWQGVAEGRVSEEARRNPGPVIDGTIAEVFAEYPAAANR